MKQIILDLHNLMKNLTIEAGVSDIRYNSIIVDIDDFNEEELKKILEWLYQIREHEYEALKKIKDLLPDEMWERYDLFNITGLTEQGLLKEAKRKLRDVWRKPYRTQEQQKRMRQRKAANKHKPIED